MEPHNPKEASQIPVNLPRGKNQAEVPGFLKETPHYEWTLLCKFGDELAKSLGNRRRDILAKGAGVRNSEEIILKS